MKKRILAALLALSLVAGMVVAPAYAAEETTQQSTGYCQHCKAVIPENEWQIWDVTQTTPETGHYYLAEDIYGQSKQINIGVDTELERRQVCLDLRGHSYTVIGLRPFGLRGIFSIMDSVGGGEIAVTGASNAHGGMVQVHRGKVAAEAAELNLYSGTLRKINDDAHPVSYGGLIYLSSGSTFNMHGGKLVGGEVVMHQIGSTYYGGYGGTVYATGSNVNIYGGTVTGGTALSGTYTNSSGKSVTLNGSGGNFYVVSDSKLTVSGGVIENGYAQLYAGNIYAKDSQVLVTGGTIRGGLSEGAAGNIQLSTSSGKTASFTMTGGTLTGGTCATRGGNLFVNNTGIELSISGGTIDGDLSVGLFKSFKLSGAPKIYMGNSNGLRLQSAENTAKIDISGLTEGAVIYLDGVDHVFTDVLEQPETYLAYFYDAVRADITVDETGALKVAQGTTGFCPHCWEQGTQATWTLWENTTPATSISVTESVHYYLGESCERTSIVTLGKSGTITDNDVIFDMAGQSWTTSGKKIFNLYGMLSLMDSVGGGKMTGTGNNVANGGVIMCGGVAKFSMYSGTLRRSVTDTTSAYHVYNGGVVYNPGGDVNIYGGIIRGGVATTPYKTNVTRGGNIYASGAFYMEGGAVIGGEALSSTSYDKDGKGTLTELADPSKPRVGSGGNLYLSGTAIISGGHIIGGSAGYGGNVYVSGSGNLEMTGGVIRNGQCADAINPNDWGGNLYFGGDENAQISNTIIRGGSTTNHGGNLYLSATTLTLHNCVIAEGYAGLESSDGRGGNLYCNGTSTVEMYTTVLGNGYAYNAGGNVYGPAGIQFNMHSGLIAGGTAASSGGNLYCNGLVMTGGVITGGEAPKGGNIIVYGAAGNFLTVRDDGDDTTAAPRISNGTATGGSGGNILVDDNAELTLENCLVEGGKSAELGGNIYLDISATAQMDGAVIRNGSGNTSSANANFDADNVYVQESASLTMTDTTVSGISAADVSGNGVCSMGAVTLKGNTRIINAERQSCVYIGTAGSLAVDAGFTGIASVAFVDAHFTDVEAPHGTALAEQNTNTGVFTGQLFLEGYLSRDYDLPGIYAVENDAKLYVASTAVVDAAGNETWYTNNAEAIAACDEGEYVKLCTTEDVVLTKNCTIDINGKSVNVSGAFTLQAFDSASDDHLGNVGTVTLEEGVITTVSHLSAEGGFYVNLVDQKTGTMTSHRMDMRVKTVSIRPKSAGIYFIGEWICDDTLKGQIKSFGMAVSANDAPGNNFAQDKDTRYTSFSASMLDSTTALTSVIIANILSNEETAEDNTNRAKTDIYVAPYIVLQDGTSLVTGKEVTYNLHDVMHLVDKVEGNLYLDNKVALENFYSTWSDSMSTWGFTYIGNTDPTDDDVLNVLLIGNSFCYYFTDELYAMLQEYYPDREINVVNAYKSGCLMREHYAWLLDSSVTRYQFITVNKDGRKTLYNMSLKEGMMLRDWDVISLQQHYPPKVAMDYDVAMETITPYDETLYNFLKTYFPKADLYWQQTWAYQIGYAGSLSAEADSVEEDNKVLDLEKQLLNHSVIRQTALEVCVRNGVTRAPLGDAWAIIRDGGNGYDNLCAREGTNSDLGDYYHDGDIGGGQYLNACVWFEMITGADCTTLTYRPSYELVDADAITFEALAAAAHQAVADMRAENAN